MIDYQSINEALESLSNRLTKLEAIVGNNQHQQTIIQEMKCIKNRLVVNDEDANEHGKILKMIFKQLPLSTSNSKQCPDQMKNVELCKKLLDIYNETSQMKVLTSKIPIGNRKQLSNTASKLIEYEQIVNKSSYDIHQLYSQYANLIMKAKYLSQANKDDLERKID